MGKLLLSGILVLVVIYLVPIIVYGIFTALAGLKTPEGASPAQFLAGVLVSKAGTAAAFVLIFYFARSAFSGYWLLYAFLWWILFLFGEIGQAIGPQYSWKEAFAGIISETIYLPVSALIVHGLIGVK